MSTLFTGAIDILAANPLLLLFIVAAVGYAIGRIHVGGASLGVAAVLFVGLGVGAIDPRLRLPDLIYQLGLVMFVYTIGLSSGPGFFASLRGRGLAHNLFILLIIGLSAGMAIVGHFLLGIDARQTSGVFTGSLTNTPALAGVIEHLQAAGVTGPAASEPVVAYSLAYPVSVLGMILAIYAFQRIWRVDYKAEAERAATGPTSPVYGKPALQSLTVRIGPQAPDGQTLGDIVAGHNWNIIFSRVMREEKVSLPTMEMRLHPGDLLTVVGHPNEIEQIVAYLGEPSDEQLEFDRSSLDYRRFFVSNPRVTGHRLRDLDLRRTYGALVTRVRRGDVEIVPHGDTVLEPGDWVRVLTTRDNLPVIAGLFGDSYRAVSEIDVLSYSLGIAAGVLLGLLPIPLPGGITIKLGLAGGPLIVALVLGALGRTGPILWNLPYSANLMLRQIGLIVFLAGIGTRSGYDFFSTLASGTGTQMLLAATIIVVVAAILTLWIGYRILRIPMGVLSGMVAGMQTQPATLGFALEQSGDERPNLGYATVFPVAVISKIVLAQMILVWLS